MDVEKKQKNILGLDLKIEFESNNNAKACFINSP